MKENSISDTQPKAETYHCIPYLPIVAGAFVHSPQLNGDEYEESHSGSQDYEAYSQISETEITNQMFEQFIEKPPSIGIEAEPITPQQRKGKVAAS